MTSYNDDIAELAQMMDALGDPWKRALRADTEDAWVESMAEYMHGERDMVLSTKAVANYWHRDPVRVFSDVVNKVGDDRCIRRMFGIQENKHGVDG